jgi:hypothetical protein
MYPEVIRRREDRQQPPRESKGQPTGRQSTALTALASSTVATLEGIEVPSNVVIKEAKAMRQKYDETLMQTIGQYRENNSCTVVALACTLDWSYGKAHRHMAKHGRKNRRGMHMETWLPALEEAAAKEGKTVRELNGPRGMTIGRFAKEYPKGTYYIRVNKHAVAIINGVMQDWTANTAGRRKILNCFKIEG